jgi:hypothetical protein
MFLSHGLTDDGEWVSIDQVGRGRTALKCPYCGVPLLAKKGEIKAAHFAHDGPTCAASVSEAAALPAFDAFDLHIPPHVLTDLRRFAGEDDNHYVRHWKLKEYDLIEVNYQGNFELTKKGKIPLGQLSLKLFLEYQAAAFLDRHAHLEERARLIKESAQAEYQTALTDLRLYRAQWRRLLQSTLYLVEVQHNSANWGLPLHKIGVTTRDINARLAEIERDLVPHLGQVQLKVLDTWAHRGSVEFYFKHRYQKAQRRLGPLTEYFLFPDLKAVLSYDLRRMPGKQLTPFEQDIFIGRGSEFEQELEAADIEARRRVRITEGMRKAQDKGHAIGRPKGQEAAAAFLGKPSTLAVIQALSSGLSIREAAAAAQVSTATVQKVKQAIADAQTDALAQTDSEP